jgi:hypothetical protein
MVKLNGALGQVFLVAVTLIFPTKAAPVIFAGDVYNAILPDPLNPNPMAPLSFVQLKVDPGGLVVNTLGETALPGQTEIGGCTEVKTGVG